MNASMKQAPRLPFVTEDHELFRDQVRRFVAREIEPNLEAWEEAGELPCELHRKAADAGLLQIGFPEACGGVEVPDLLYPIIVTEELARTGSAGLGGSLLSHTIATPPLAHLGTPEQQQRFAAPVLAGEKIAALAITEPGAGSDVASLKTRAVRDGDHYLVNGSKIFITSGMRADFVTTAVRTGGEGMSGLSLLVIETNAPGFSRSPLDKMGCWCSDTAALYFQDCRVPAANLLGPENGGFMAIMKNFNQERMTLISSAVVLAEVCYDDALAHARERHTFGKPLIANQVIRHKLVDMRTRLEAVKANRDLLLWHLMQRRQPVAEICMLKAFATTTLEYVVNEAMQILGGAGYLRGCRIERIYREAKVLTIGGGSLEIMKDLASRQLGY
jgi:acyl-CoA dehydrogenase